MTYKTNMLRSPAAWLSAASIVATLGFVGPVFAADTEVKIDNFTFNPATITVKAGTTVTWTNGDDIPHTVVGTTKVFKSNVLDTDGKFSFTFTTPGSYEYFCSLHPHMKASIVVEATTGENVSK
jgi:plastocyanin